MSTSRLWNLILPPCSPITDRAVPAESRPQPIGHHSGGLPQPPGPACPKHTHAATRNHRSVIRRPAPHAACLASWPETRPSPRAPRSWQGQSPSVRRRTSALRAPTECRRTDNKCQTILQIPRNAGSIPSQTRRTRKQQNIRYRAVLPTAPRIAMWRQNGGDARLVAGKGGSLNVMPSGGLHASRSSGSVWTWANKSSAGSMGAPPRSGSLGRLPICREGILMIDETRLDQPA